MFLVFVIDQTHIHTTDSLFIITELGVSPGAAAGTAVVVLLVAAAIAADVVYYFRPRISQLP
ncbi:hypothetical protein M9458_044837, partial [Cirrhinus mrigala]